MGFSREVEARAAAPITRHHERRFVKNELRVERLTGKSVLEGYAATFGTLSGDLGGWRERIAKGAFARAIREKQDVRHLVNHDPSSVLGRTKAGTLKLSEDSVGLRFRTELPDTSVGRDLVESVGRGDLDGCSFAFVSIKDSWGSEPDPETGAMIDVRQLLDVDLFDVSVVAYPAYPGTTTGLVERMKLMFPGTNGQMPAEVRLRIGRAPEKPEARRGPIALGLADEKLRHYIKLREQFRVMFLPAVSITDDEREERAAWCRWADRILESGE